MARAGEELYNPVTGERIRFVRTYADTNGELFEADETFAPGSPRQPLHVHPRQESRIVVVSGLCGYRIGHDEGEAGPGAELATPAGTPHRIWNAGDTPLVARISYRPALEETERFFETFFALAADGKTDREGMPGLLRLAVMVPAYADYIRLARPPWALQRLLFGALAPLGRLRGYAADYRAPDAPASVAGG